MFTKAIVRTPAPSMVNGLTSAQLGKPDYNLAIKQHAEYIKALESCGLDVICLDADPDFPDSTFVEDVALLTANSAIITNPGALSRRGEVKGMRAILDDYYTQIYAIQSPGTLEAGDVMMVGTHFYIGLSERTNRNGAEQLIANLESYELSGSVVELKDVLHLKTGVAYLEHNNLVACGEFLSHPDFQEFNLIPIDATESYAANCIWVNDTVLVPLGFPKTREAIRSVGYQTVEIDVSEFQKLDGGLSCLSLRF
ncbi:MAG: N(G),N(G)-dimethylarginine dimethylaminohydrolase [Candidatus Marinimicrobia bacterium]|jgi:dimethylargininase|nr:N(G),N(G)-dimethylarginine dimethylaminohydrolase [Candidatus Neomarinimicrobiota bacterium]MBT3576484.1 N(G),N(G)-dimethylarginine dimethylaminohydrolase [Candidatus Neomarinimicrobiota bacterium]MBT3681270.1 N(G),N(G)-dimethylarginine dimethylaminohydrolase [Candidatus Neomarinimicrobiota bacterium]MBT4130094.1 N(G),N(G)-dimethylarginine dimethylaminohydrolase [Candidatus Neomarinimicrobiota bacterium]MBT4295181.1 N(G),N(G)-dimethylarginine dimethylaminohydrolase [Candidatus Neomarinimicro